MAKSQMALGEGAVRQCQPLDYYGRHPAMNATRILPDLQCSLLCEDVRPEANSNFILVGVIGLVRVPQVPVTAFKLCVFNRWTAGLGEFTESVRLIAPDQTTILR